MPAPLEDLVSRIVAVFDTPVVRSGAATEAVRDGVLEPDEMDLDIACYRLGERDGAAGFVAAYDANGDGRFQPDELHGILRGLDAGALAHVESKLIRLEAAQRDYDAAAGVFGGWELVGGRRLHRFELEEVDKVLQAARLAFVEQLVRGAAR